MTDPDFIIPPQHPMAAPNREPRRLSRIETVLEAMIAHLKVRMPGGMRIEHFPDRPDDYDFSGHDAALLVLYSGSKFGTEGLRGAQGTSETMQLDCVLLFHNLRAEGDGMWGAYRLIDEVRSALHGVSFGGSTGLRPTAIELTAEVAGGFQYRLGFEASLPALPVPPRGVMMPRQFQQTPRGGEE